MTHTWRQHPDWLRFINEYEATKKNKKKIAEIEMEENERKRMRLPHAPSPSSSTFAGPKPVTPVTVSVTEVTLPMADESETRADTAEVAQPLSSGPSDTQDTNEPTLSQSCNSPGFYTVTNGHNTTTSTLSQSSSLMMQFNEIIDDSPLPSTQPRHDSDDSCGSASSSWD